MSSPTISTEPHRGAPTEADFALTALTHDPRMVRALDAAGVDRVGVDIERLGKGDRQGWRPELRLSDDELDDLASVVANVTSAQPLVRVNPLYDGTSAEIDRAIELGAAIVVLPYFNSVAEARRFVELVGGRSDAILMVETIDAALRIGEIVAIDGVAEIMVGLNDLRLGLGCASPFDVLVSGLLESVAETVCDAGIRLGVGGVARAHDDSLPIAPDLVYAQYPRLGATAAWLARSFYVGIDPDDIASEVREARDRLAYWKRQSAAELDHQRALLARVAATSRGRLDT